MMGVMRFVFIFLFGVIVRLVSTMPKAYAQGVVTDNPISLVLGIILYLFLLYVIFLIFRTHRSVQRIEKKLEVLKPYSTTYCHYCGTENRTDAIYCQKCGKRIN